MVILTTKNSIENFLLKISTFVIFFVFRKSSTRTLVGKQQKNIMMILCLTAEISRESLAQKENKRKVQTVPHESLYNYEVDKSLIELIF